MNNPYAPPEDRRRTDARPPDEVDAGAGSEAGGTGTGASAPGGADGGPGSRVPTEWRPAAPPLPPAGGTAGWGRRRPSADPRPPNPDDVIAVLTRTRRIAVLALASVALLLLPMPWVLTSLPFALVAAVQAVRAIRMARRTRVAGPARTTLRLLAFLSMGAVVLTLVSVALWPLQAPYVRCHQAALTVQAQQACISQAQDRLEQLGGKRP